MNDYVQLRSADVKGNEITLLTDSRAHINLEKTTVLNDWVQWDINKAVMIKSIAKDRIWMEESVRVRLKTTMRNEWVTKFQDRDALTELPFDSLLAREFLESNRIILH